MADGVRVERIHRRKLAVGLLMVLLGIAMPLMFNVRNFGVRDTLMRAITEQERLYVLFAALKLVLLNSLRGFPHYLGAFLIAESIEVTFNGRENKLFKAAVVCVIIPPVYLIIERLHGIRYDFGVPALVLITLLTFLGKADYNFVSPVKKSLMVVMLITAFQFLDVMPSLAGLPFGRGETSMDVKLISRFLESDGFLDVSAVFFFLLLLFVGVLLFMLIRDENHLRAVSEQKEQNERMLMETRMRVLENRTYMELQHLVHDLKSPLTSAQALVGLVKLGSERDGRTRELEYLGKIERSIERMSTMISEILYESHRTPVTTGELLSAVLAQISIAEYAELVTVENRAPDLVISVNKIRFVRALINLIENSFYAVERGTGVIRVEIDRPAGEPPLARFVIGDNGGGISPELLDLIWEKGFSTRSSHGLGLSFVQSVVTLSGGSIDIDSAVGRGTTMTILMPAGGDSNEPSD